jgi:hypothetical protein
MLQLACDFRLAEESIADLLIVGKAILDLLERDGAIQLVVFGDEHIPHAAAGMERHDAEAAGFVS